MELIKDLRIQNPMVVAKDGTAVILVSANDVTDAPIDNLAKAQLYEPADDTFSPVLPLGSFGKFLYSLQEVVPPQAFIQEQLRHEYTDQN